MQESDSSSPTVAVNETKPWLLTLATPEVGWVLMLHVSASLSVSEAVRLTEPVPLALQVSVAGLAVVMVGAWLPPMTVTLGPISNHATV